MKQVAKKLAEALYPEEEHPLPTYRKMLSSLNQRLGTVTAPPPTLDTNGVQQVEVAIAGKDWASIKPGAVPARCLTRHRDAFMNLAPSKKPRSESMDRRQCAANFTEHALLAASGKARLHGADPIRTHGAGGTLIFKRNKISVVASRHSLLEQLMHLWSFSGSADSFYVPSTRSSLEAAANILP